MNYKNLKTRIKKNEGFSCCAYKDQLGNLTIGYGHLIKKNEKYLLNKKLKKSFFDNLFELDFLEALKGYNKNFKKNKHTKKTQELIIEMIFQMGSKKVLKFKKMFKNINNNNKYLTALEMMNSLWYRQTPKRVNDLIKNYLY